MNADKDWVGFGGVRLEDGSVCPCRGRSAWRNAHAVTQADALATGVGEGGVGSHGA